MVRFPDDDPTDLLPEEGTPHPTGAVIQQAQLRQAPDIAPTPTVEVDAYASGITQQPEVETQSAPESAPAPSYTPPKVRAPANPQVQQLAQTPDAYSPQQVEQPVISHRRFIDPRLEARQQQQDQGLAARQQAEAQRAEDKRAAGVVRGLKGQGVEMETDPVTGQQSPKLDEQGRPLYTPKTLQAVTQSEDGRFVKLQRDRLGNETEVEIKPKIDTVTGEKYIEDEGVRQSLGVDKGFVLRRDAATTGQQLALARQQAADLAKQKKDAQKKIADLGTEAGMVAADSKLSDDEKRLKVDAIRKQREALVQSSAPLSQQADDAHTQLQTLQGDYASKRQAMIDHARQTLGLPSLAPKPTPLPPEVDPNSPEGRQRWSAQQLDQAKAGGKPYGVKDGKIDFGEERPLDALTQAVADGVMSNPPDEVWKAVEEKQKLIVAAGSNPKLKAVLTGAGRGAAFMAGAPVGAGAGAALLSETGPGAAIGGLVGGLVTGSVAAYGYGKLLEKLGQYNDTINSFVKSQELHPGYAAAGELGTFATGLPRVAMKAAGAALGRGADAAAEASRVAGSTADATRATVNTARAGMRAAEEAGGVATATAEATPDALYRAGNYLNAIGKAYSTSGGGLVATIENLSDLARTAAGQKGNTFAALQVAKRVATAAAGMVAIDTVLKEGSYQLGLSPERQTAGGAGVAAVLGAFAAGHGIELKQRSSDEVGDILLRGMAHDVTGTKMGSKVDLGKLASTPDVNPAAMTERMTHPLTPEEEEVYHAFNQKASQLLSEGKISADPRTWRAKAQQILFAGRKGGVTNIEIAPKDGAETTGKAPAGTPTPKALTEGTPPAPGEDDAILADLRTATQEDDAVNRRLLEQEQETLQAQIDDTAIPPDQKTALITRQQEIARELAAVPAAPVSQTPPATPSSEEEPPAPIQPEQAAPQSTEAGASSTPSPLGEQSSPVPVSSGSSPDRTALVNQRKFAVEMRKRALADGDITTAELQAIHIRALDKQLAKTTNENATTSTTPSGSVRQPNPPESAPGPQGQKEEAQLSAQGTEKPDATRPGVPAGTEPGRGDAGSVGKATTGFTTAKGSRYVINPDGTTTRDKAKRIEHEDSGPMPKSDATFYVDAEGLEKLGEVQTKGGAGTKTLRQRGNQWGMYYLDGKDAGKFEQRTLTDVHTQPAIGLIPVEMWKGSNQPHFGNPIISVEGGNTTPEPTAPDTRSAKALVQKQLFKGKAKRMLDAIGAKVREQADDRGMSAEFDDKGNVFLNLDYDRLEQRLADKEDREGLVQAALSEEIKHIAGLEAVKQGWVSAKKKGPDGRPEGFRAAVRREYNAVYGGMTDTQRQFVQQVYGDPKAQDWQLGAEFIRQLLQADAGEIPTEGLLQEGGRGVIRQFIERVLAVLKRFLDNKDTWSQPLQKAYDDTKAVLARMEPTREPGGFLPELRPRQSDAAKPLSEGQESTAPAATPSAPSDATPAATATPRTEPATGISTTEQPGASQSSAKPTKATAESKAPKISAEADAALDDAFDGLSLPKSAGGDVQMGRLSLPPDTAIRELDNATIAGPAAMKIIAHHGTPHKVDRFSLDKIGTGEGAQVYGWGLYFAQEAKVAENYQKKLSKSQEGNTYTVAIDGNHDDLLDWDKPLSEQSEKARKAIMLTAAKWMAGRKDASVQDLLNYLGSQLGGERAASEAIRAAGVPGIRFLDQESRVRPIDVERARKQMEQHRAFYQRDASEHTRQMYLGFKESVADLEKKQREGTYNYVIFDEARIQITHENGEPVKGGTLGLPPVRKSEPQSELPPDKIPAFIKSAQSLIASGIKTPESLAQVLDAKFEKRFRKYSEALWDAFGIANKSLRGTHQWEEIYGKLDAATSEKLASNEEEKSDAPASLGDTIEKALASGETVDRRRMTELAKESGLTPKQVDETAEAAVVRVARDLVQAEGGSPEAKFDKLLDLYNRQPNLTAKTSASKIQQAYSTPVPLAYLGSQLAQVRGAEPMQESTAGNGALAMEANPKTALINEIDPARAEALRAQGFTVSTEDATKWTPAKRAKRVNINPPFGQIKGENGEWLEWNVDGLKTHQIDHAISMQTLANMEDDGRAVLIIGGTQAVKESERRGHYAMGERGEFFRQLYSKYGVVDHFTVDGDLYKKQGAGWPVDVITIAGRRKSPIVLPSTQSPRILHTWDELKAELSRTDDERISSNQYDEARDRGELGGSLAGIRGSLSGGAGHRGERNLSDPAGGAGELGARAGGDLAELPKSGAAEDVLQPAARPESRVGDGAVDEQRASVTDQEDGAGPVFHAPYEPVAKGPKFGIETPINLAEPQRAALEKLEQKVGPLAEYVRGKLAYPEGTDVGEYFSAEQLDALALAMSNIEGGGSLVLADQCVAGETRIFDPVTGVHTPIAELCERGREITVLAWNGRELFATTAKAPFRKGVADLYRVTCEDGRSITVTTGHRFLTPSGWRSISEGLCVGSSLVFSEALPPKNLELPRLTRAEGVPHSRRTILDSRLSYLPCLSTCDGQLQSELGICLSEPPSPVDAHARTRCYSRKDDRAFSGECNHRYQSACPPSRNSSSPLESRAPSLISTRVRASFGKLSDLTRRNEQPSQDDSTSPHLTLGEVHQGQLALTPHTRYEFSSSFGDTTGTGRIAAIEFVRRDEFFDMVVPRGSSYVAEGFINHNTGIGKGRVVAGLMEYAKQNGITPIFVTKEPKLYSAMLGDVADVGKEINPVYTNSDLNMDHPKTGVNIRQGSTKKVMEQIAATGKLPEGKDAIFTSYDQIGKEINKAESEESRKSKVNSGGVPMDGPRNMALKALARGKVLFLLDESHLAAGDSIVGRRLRGMIAKAPVYYSSATFAKRPDAMPLYFRTNMGRAAEGGNIDKLIPVFERGGVTMQQVASQMLAADGQLLRRERSYNGVTFQTHINLDTEERDRGLADQYTDGLRTIMDMSRKIEKATKDLNGVLSKLGKKMDVAMIRLESADFASQVHNFVHQYLFAIKAEAAVQQTIKAIKQGYPAKDGAIKPHKVILAIQNTMQGPIEALAKSGLSVSFNGLLQKTLDGLRTMKSGKGDSAETFTIEKTPNPAFKNLSLSDLERMMIQVKTGPTGEQVGTVIPEVAMEYFRRLANDQFEQAERALNDLDLGDMPISPIDHIRDQLKAAGIRTGEITGRTSGYREGAPYDRNPEEVTKKGQLATLAEFNNSNLDALIINGSGSTGISAHASSLFKRPDPRMMIVVQPHQDINEFMQMLGRIFRSGQIEMPRYMLLQTALPAEKRPAAILGKKMAGLNANTTSNADSEVSSGANVVDMFNQYGDEVAWQYLADNPTFLHDLQWPKVLDKKGNLAPLADLRETLEEDGKLSRAVASYGAILPVEAQEAFWEKFVADYTAKIAYLDQIGENKMRVGAEDIGAETISRTVYTSGNPEGTSEFDKPSYVEDVKIKPKATPYTAEEVAKLGDEAGKTREETLAKFKEGANAFAKEYLARRQEKNLANWADLEPRERARLNNQASLIAGAIRQLGEPVILNTETGKQVAMVVGFEPDPKAPLTPSKQMVVLATNTLRRQIKMPISQMMERVGPLERDVFTEQFDESREDKTGRKIITGNLVAAFSKLNGSGKVVQYTKSDGITATGIMLAQGFDPFEAATEALSSPAKVAEALTNGQEVTSRDGRLSLETTAGGGFVMRVPSAKATGGKYWQYPALNRVMEGGTFEQRGSSMVGRFSDMGAVFAVLRNGLDVELVAKGGSDKLSLPSEPDYAAAAAGVWLDLAKTPQEKPTAKELESILAAYDKASKATGFSAVAIAEVMEGAGFTLRQAEEAKAKLVSMMYSGEVMTFTAGDWSLSDFRKRAWGVNMSKRTNYEPPQLMVRMSPTAKLSAPPDQTESPAFKAWFGKSKVVDARGLPLAVGHGGGRKITEFKDSPSRGQIGAAYFNDQKSVPWHYAINGGINSEHNLAEQRRIQLKHNPTRTPVVTKAFLKMENPMDFRTYAESPKMGDVLSTLGHEKVARYLEREDPNADSEISIRVADEMNVGVDSNEYEPTGPDDASIQDKADWLKRNPDAFAEIVSDNHVENDAASIGKNSVLRFLAGAVKADGTTLLHDYMDAKGHDGLIYPDAEAGGNTYVVRSPGQIKSATDNRGTFDPSDASILNAPPDPASDTQPSGENIRVLKAALGDLPEVQRKVLTMRVASKSDAEIISATGLSATGVENAYRSALAKMKAARAKASEVEGVRQEVKAEPKGTRTMGRPDLANPGKGPATRLAQDAVDEARNRAGIPAVRPDVEVEKEALDMISRDRSGIEETLMDISRTGGMLNDVQTVAAKRIVAAGLLNWVRRSGDPDAILKGVMLSDGWRVSGAEQARAFRQRRDAVLTPTQRLREYVSEAIFTPDAKRQKAIDTARKNGDQDKRNEILKDWAKQIEKLKEKLRQLGVDLDTMTDDDFRKLSRNPIQAQRILRSIQQAKGDLFDQVYEYWVASVLSGIGSNVANLAGNVANAAFDFSLQRLAEATVNLAVRDKESASFGEFSHLLKGVAPGWARAGRNMVTAWGTENPVFEEEVLGKPGTDKLEQRHGAIPGKLGRVIRTPLRLLTAMDDWSKSMVGTMQVQAEAFRMAKAEGLTGDALASRMKLLTMTPSEAAASYLPLVKDEDVEPMAKSLAGKNAADFADKTSEAWEQARRMGALKLAEEDGYSTKPWEKASEKATELSFQEDLGPIGRGINTARREYRALGFIFPFIKTMSNILRIGFRKTPLGSVPLLYRTLRSGAARMNWGGKDWTYSRADFVRHAAEQLIAWGAFFALKSLTMPDDKSGTPTITGTTPFSPQNRGKRDLAYRTAPPQSIRIGDRWYSYARIEPFATGLAVTVDLMNAMEEKNADVTQRLGDVFTHLVGQLQEKTFAKGVSDVMRAIQDGESAVEWAANFATSWVPNIIRASARETDGMVREGKIWGKGDEWKDRLIERTIYKALPLGTLAPPAKVDLWGNLIKKDTFGNPATDFLARVMLPVKTANVEKVQDLDRLLVNWNNQNPNDGYYPQQPAPAWTLTRDGKKVTIAMSDPEYSTFLQMAGKMAAARLQVAPLNIQNPSEADMKTITEAISAARTEARKRVWQERALGK